jgi:branched-chain amino acid transport system substrate-binding protein
MDRLAWAQPGKLSAPLRVGLMLPHSSPHAQAHANLRAGMNLAFEQMSSEAATVSLVAEPIGFSPTGAKLSARNLLEQNEMDVVVALVNERITHQMYKLFHVHKTPLVVLNVGANIADDAGEREYLTHKTLGHWQANGALGNWAAHNVGTRAAMMMSFYESGYDTPYAFQHGFEAAGGEVMESTVTHLPNGEGLASVLARISAANPDFVYALYSGTQAVEFVRAYAEAGLAGRIPLVGSAYLVDEAHLASLDSAVGIRSAFSWSPSLRSAANDAFNLAYMAASGRAADSFALLGYDTAKFIGEAARRAGSKARMPSALKAANTSAPVYLREVQRVNGRLQNIVVAELDSATATVERARTARSELKSGWVNPYLVL